MEKIFNFFSAPSCRGSLGCPDPSIARRASSGTYRRVYIRPSGSLHTFPGSRSCPCWGNLGPNALSPHMRSIHCPRRHHHRDHDHGHFRLLEIAIWPSLVPALALQGRPAPVHPAHPAAGRCQGAGRGSLAADNVAADSRGAAGSAHVEGGSLAAHRDIPGADNADTPVGDSADNLAVAYEDTPALPHLVPADTPAARAPLAVALGWRPAVVLREVLLGRPHVFAAIPPAHAAASMWTLPWPRCSSTSLAHICSLAMAAPCI